MVSPKAVFVTELVFGLNENVSVVAPVTAMWLVLHESPLIRGLISNPVIPACRFWSHVKVMLSSVERALKLVGLGTVPLLGIGVCVTGTMLKFGPPAAKFDCGPGPTLFTARICIRYSAPASSGVVPIALSV